MSDNIIQIFGEVLFDHFPDGHCVLGGAPFNVAWHLQAFGQSPRFISRIGQDQTGEAVRQAMREWRMDMSGLQLDKAHPTGAVRVSIDRGEPSYSIVPEQAYDFIDADHLPAVHDHGLLYHGTLVLRHPVSKRALEAVKRQHGGLVFMDVNLREPWWDKDGVLALVDDADWVKLNHHELQLLQGDSTGPDESMRHFLQRHRLQGLVVTRGEQGAIALTAGGEEVRVVPEAAQAVVDTVGAGDAFASVLMLGIQLGWSLPNTLARAQAFASALVGCRGATVADEEFYRPFIVDWGLQVSV